MWTLFLVWLGAKNIICADVNDARLDLAKKMGADVCINSKNKDLREEIMKLTDGNGVARLVEASGFSPVVNSCFSLLRKVIYAIKCSSFFLHIYHSDLKST